MTRQDHLRAPEAQSGITGGSASHSVDLDDRATVADVLVAAHPCRCDFHAKRSVESFRRLGVRKYRMWFDDILDSPADEIAPEDRRYILGAWNQWVAGEDPFGVGRRRVSG